MICWNPCEFFQFFFEYLNLRFSKKKKKSKLIVKLLLPSPRKFSNVLWDLVTKNIPKNSYNVTLIFLNFEKKIRNLKKNEKIHKDSEKWINWFKIKKPRILDHLVGTFFYHFVNNFSALFFGKINVVILQ